MNKVLSQITYGELQVGDMYRYRDNNTGEETRCIVIEHKVETVARRGYYDAYFWMKTLDDKKRVDPWSGNADCTITNKDERGDVDVELLGFHRHDT